ERGIHFQIESNLVQPRRILVERRKNHVPELVRGQFYLALTRTSDRSPELRVVTGCKRKREPEPESVVAQFDSCEDLEINGHGLLRADIADGEVHNSVAVVARE